MGHFMPDRAYEIRRLLIRRQNRIGVIVPAIDSVRPIHPDVLPHRDQDTPQIPRAGSHLSGRSRIQDQQAFSLLQSLGRIVIHHLCPIVINERTG